MNGPTVDSRPEETIRWAVERFGRRLVVSSSFGNPEGTALLHMVARVDPSIPVAWVNTGFLFPETVAFKEGLARRLGLRVIEVVPRLTPEEQAACYGSSLWTTDPDLCCRIRKVEPLFALLHGFDGWMTGIRRGQTEARTGTQVVEEHHLPPVLPADPGRTITKINPLVGWTREQVWAYLDAYDLPHNPLLDEGYPSLGCVHCTRRIAPAGARVDDRSGRWWGRAKTECGLHTATRRWDEGPSLSPGSHPGRA